MQKKIVNQHNIDRLIEEWHKSDSKLEVYEYIGITKEEYFQFVETGKLKTAR